MRIDFTLIAVLTCAIEVRGVGSASENYPFFRVDLRTISPSGPITPMVVPL